MLNDREKLIKFIHGAYSYTLRSNSGNPIKDVNHKIVENDTDCAVLADILIANGLTVQNHGRWSFMDFEYFDCSVCGDSYYNGADSSAQARSYLNSGHYYKYCPHCGSKMDGDKK